MTTSVKRPPLMTVAASLMALTLALTASAAAQRPLKILLTNDDGVDSAGLKIMRAALVERGHQVTVVAPATNMSSSSMSMTSGVLKVERRDDSAWAVHGTPTDAVMIGLAHIRRETPQDLVVSGTNAGQNLGSSTNGSGTVSAAIAAARFGVPAIATSAGIGQESGTAYDVAAMLVAQMAAALDSTRTADGKLLPDRIVINLNVPALPVGKLRGIRWAPLSRRSAYARVYSDTGTPNEVRSRLTLSRDTGGETDTDLVLFNRGWVTLTLLDGDVSAGAAAAADVSARLAKLALPQPAQ